MTDLSGGMEQAVIIGLFIVTVSTSAIGFAVAWWVFG